VTWILTSAAALLALLVNARNLGLTPWLEGSVFSFADHAAARIMVTPRNDTLNAIGDTTVLAATVTDHRGAVLSGARVIWAAADSAVVSVDSTGAVVARGPGSTWVAATVRDLTARALLTVWQIPRRVLIAGDSAVRIQQGDTLQFAAIALDARGHRIAQVTPRWQSRDTTVVQVDSLGTAIGRSAGHSRLWAAVGGSMADVGVEVELTATAVEVLGGDHQHAIAGRPLPGPIVLRAMSPEGRPVPGAVATVMTGDGEGQALPRDVVADRDGRFRITWTLSRHAGPQRVMVRLSTTDSLFSVFAEADPEPGTTRTELLSPRPEGRAGAFLVEPVRLRFTDTSGAALAGVPVSWRLLDGGTVEAPARTDSLGEALARWQLGPHPGPQRLLAQIGSPRAIPAFRVTASALPGPPAALAVGSGSGQVGQAGRPLAKAIAVVVRDSAGAPVPGVNLTASTPTGSIAIPVQTTDSAGRVAFRWTLGPEAGPQTLRVRAESVPHEAGATATAVPGPPVNLELLETPAKSGQPRRLVATVTDVNGNPVQGASVRFVARGGRLSASSQTTDLTGRARVSWTPGRDVTAERVTATVRGTQLRALYPATSESGTARSP
jgi:hypothetical protein